VVLPSLFGLVREGLPEGTPLEIACRMAVAASVSEWQMSSIRLFESPTLGANLLSDANLELAGTDLSAKLPSKRLLPAIVDISICQVQTAG
jgi:hypothetical protein